ncbi:MAG TPA: choline ABC transporter permease subunit, partial [Paracoccus sp.]|nr:choline ABC transporter permease subunit [Paracoccus sp. (in: a-proteobacteria)]
MERLTAILTESKLPVGRTARQIFDWLKLHAEPVFGAVAGGLGVLVDAIHATLVFAHPLLFTAAAVALALLLRRGAVVAFGVGAGF